ncbi:hypothetical protein ACFPVX_05820 [Cohnella faecalis]|uniref:Sporulation protein n=1 Tax=Cohnella faecalis TaxID=2315694 RepID=A0A398CQP7_9BACL|nr:hypothetical protein [Cohnella faecalis]RIE02147.1 hypothetical protein D3H35_15450 [Cohnella faecalis]
MKKTTTLAALGVGTLLLLSACQATSMRQKSVAQEHAVENKQNARAIHQMERKTDERGPTSHGMGTSVYSIIGSSGLHSHGLSSHLESRLGSAGITGVKAFTLDDMVILATAKRKQEASAQSDELQQKLLSPSGSLSGRSLGGSPGRIGKLNADGAGADNIASAEKWIHENLGSGVKVYSLVDPEAVAAIERIRSHADAAPAQQADDIQRLLQLAKAPNK